MADDALRWFSREKLYPFQNSVLKNSVQLPDKEQQDDRLLMLLAEFHHRVMFLQCPIWLQPQTLTPATQHPDTWTLALLMC